MKKKVISLITGILSFVDALALLGVTLVCIFKINSVARVITDTTDDLWGIEMITYAGMGYILAILGIIISAGLAGYRGMLVYYYIKIFSSDEDFYAERRSGIIGFSLLGGILFAVGAVVLIERFSFIPSRMYPFITAFTILYGFLVFLPIIELILSGIIGKRVKKNTENQIPTKESVIEELDELADLQVEEKTEDVKREDKKDEEKATENKTKVVQKENSALKASVKSRKDKKRGREKYAKKI